MHLSRDLSWRYLAKYASKSLNWKVSGKSWYYVT